MSANSTIAGADWLARPALQRLLAVLSADGECARPVGGAVRNTLIGEPVKDVDIATTTLPQETIRRAEEAGFRAVPTGIDHGTITVIAEGTPYEVTTLRSDIETDGRRATVVFGRDWALDAGRRDFTINALYAEADGTVVDLVGGLADIGSRTVRFIGDADQRIREDYLRILRFFRFFAQYGGGRPDAEGLKACARLKDGVDRLSAERVWMELRKTLAASDPARALLWMRQSGVLTRVLPETEKWGIDGVHGLVSSERDLGWAPDPMLRLEAIVPPDAPRMKELAARLKLSNAERDRLVASASAALPKPDTGEAVMARMLYGGDEGGIRDRLMLALASARSRAPQDQRAMADAGGFRRLLAFATGWSKPIFPLRGEDLLSLGMSGGPALGALLTQLEAGWVASGFALDRKALLDQARARVGG